MRKINISKRALKAPASPIRKLYFYAEKAKKKGITVHHLNIGQPDLPTPKEFFREVRKFNQKTVAYAPSEGYQEVIKAWQQYYRGQGLNFSENEIIVTTGGSEAIIFALVIAANPGEEVMVFEPLYPNYITFAQMTGLTLKPVTLSPKDNFHLPSRQEIIKHVSSRTKAVIICHPSNPTGTVFSKKELQMIVDIVQKYNLFIIADEAYREFVFDDKKHISLMEFLRVKDRVILVDSVSKRFNVCGARIGCLASKNKKVIEAALKLAQGRLSSPTLEQLAVIPFLKNSRRYTKAVVQEYQKRRDVVIAALCDLPGTYCYSPEGTFYLFTSLPVKSTEHFSQWLLEKFHYKKETVMLTPGNGFYVNKGLGLNEVRIAYVLNRSKLKRVMMILNKAIAEYKKEFD